MNKLYIICFDVCDKKRLRKVAIQLENVGVRVQYSLFECYLSPKQLKNLQKNITQIINTEEDHVRYYGLCPKDKPNILLDGYGTISKQEDYYFA